MGSHVYLGLAAETRTLFSHREREREILYAVQGSCFLQTNLDWVGCELPSDCRNTHAILDSMGRLGWLR